MAQNFRIRPYDAVTDFEPCVDIWRAASFAGHAFLGADALAADEVKVRQDYMSMAEIRVATIDDRPVGFIALIDSFVGGLFVDPARHRQGIGRQLMDDALARKGSLTLEVYERNASALAFYRALGFHPKARRDKDDQGRPFALVTLGSAG